MLTAPISPRTSPKGIISPRPHPKVAKLNKTKNLIYKIKAKT